MLSDFQNLIEQMVKDSSLEAYYQEQVKQNPQLVTQFLIQTISMNPNSELSNFSIILLSRLVSVMSENFISIGNQEFHEDFSKRVLGFMCNPVFSPFSLSLISDLVSRITLSYSYSEELDTNDLFFPLIMENIHSENVDISHAAINALVYCIYNESIDYQAASASISDFLEAVLTNEDISTKILLPSLRILYLTFDSISFDFNSILPDIFERMKNSIELMNQSIHDIISYLPAEKYSLFKDCSVFFILYFSEILGFEDMPKDLQYCSIEIIYNFSKSFYNEFSDNCKVVLDNIFLFLSNNETENKESKYIISQLSEKYGGFITFANHCYDIFYEILKNDNDNFPNKQIAAMKLFSYCYRGNAVHLTYNLSDEIFETIFQSGVIDSPHELVRIAAFDMLSSLLKTLSNSDSRFVIFHPMNFFQNMIECIENVDEPIVLSSKFKSFKYYVECIDKADLENILPDLEDTLLDLVENSLPEQIVHILSCIEVFIIQLSSYNFDKFKEYFLEILQNPATVTFDIYITILQTSTYLADFPEDVFNTAFSYIMDLDYELLTAKDINSLIISIYRICISLPSSSIIPNFINYSIKGLMNDVEYSTIKLQELSSTMCIHASIEKQNNILRRYDDSQIQLIIYFLKVLRYSISTNSEIISDIVQENAETIYDILLKWTSINFSDKIRYNALKLVHIFMVLTKYEFPFESLLDQMMIFTYSETEESHLKVLYQLIFNIFFDTLKLDRISEEIISSTLLFYSHELEKENQRREEICEQTNLGNCTINQNDAEYLETSLSMIWLPFLNNPNIDNSFFSELIDLSMNNVCITSIIFIGNYYMHREQKTELIDYLVSIYIASTDEEENERCEDVFYFADSKCASLFIISYINEKILPQNDISSLLDIFAQRTKIVVNCSLYLSIIILIADKYSDCFDSIEIFSLVNRAKNLYYFDSSKIQIVIQAWNNIFPIISQQSFDTDTLAIILGILHYFKKITKKDVFETQQAILLQNFQEDQDELHQSYQNFIKQQLYYEQLLQ